MSEKPFACAITSGAPDSLRGVVLARVTRLQRRSLVSRIIFSVAVEVASIVAVVASFSHITQSLEASGTLSYLRLVVSEGFGIVGYSRELALSVAESLPVLAVAALLAAALSFGWSTLRLTRQSLSAVSHA